MRIELTDLEQAALTILVDQSREMFDVCPDPFCDGIQNGELPRDQVKTAVRRLFDKLKLLASEDHDD